MDGNGENLTSASQVSSQDSSQNTGISGTSERSVDQKPVDSSIQEGDDIKAQGSKVVRNPFLGVKKRLSELLLKLKTLWQNLPRKNKVLILVSASLVLLVSGYVVFVVRPAKLRDLGERGADLNFADFGDWERLSIPQRETPFFTLAAATKSKYGILPEEVFVLKSREAVSEDFVRDNIVSSVPVSVSSISTREFNISPENNLGLDEILKIKLDVENDLFQGHVFDRDYSWAYQTQGKFRVVSSIPGDQKAGVPVTTGIEIVFSQDDYWDPTNFVSVSPSFKFRTERHAETFVVVPLEPLQEKTVYTVTLKSGLNLQSRNDPIDEDYVFQFQTDEKIKKPSHFSLTDDFQQVSSDEPLVTKVYSYNWGTKVVKTEVYKFPSVSAFVDSRKDIDEISSSWMRYFAEEEAVDTGDLERVMTADLKIEKKDSVEFLQLPDKLDTGFYIVQFWSEARDELEQLWFQSTKLTGYVSVGKEQTVVWVNDVDSGPSGDAAIRIVGSEGEHRTSDNGVAVFGTNQVLFDDNRHYIEVTSEGQKRVVLPVDSLSDSSRPGEITKDDYWSYLYNERSLYKPDDTLNFFGVVKERDTGRPPSLVNLSLKSGRYGEQEEILSRTVSPSSDGSFIGSFELNNIPRGSYSLVLEVNDTLLASSWLSVKEFEKPELKIEVSADKKAIFTDEEVNYVARVSFFDGTPASRIPVKVHESVGGKETKMETSESGEIKYVYKTTYKDDKYVYYPRYESVTVSPSIAQEKIVEGHGSVYVYGSKLMISSESEQDEEKAKISAEVHNVDLSRVNSGDSSDVKGDPAVGQSVALIVTKNWYEKREVGTYYDFIEKVTRKSYEYIPHSDVVEQKTLKTDGEGRVSHEFVLEEQKSYDVELVVKDIDGHPANTTEYYYYSSSFYPRQVRETPELNLDKEENEFSIGEEVKLNVLLGDKEYPDNDQNRFLFITADQGRQEVVLSDNPRYNFQFENKHIPSVYVGAVVFTGKYYSSVRAPCRRDWYCSYYHYYSQRAYFDGLEVLYKRSDSELDLTVRTDKDQYKPGEEASVTVKVTKNGGPINGASVNVVLVDQALAAMGVAKEPSILPSLYESLPDRIYFNYSTHEPVFPEEPAAEMGGGGPGERELFKDAAFFGQATSDENGEVVFNFKLPDNITSWIVYSQAVTADLDAGQVEGGLVVSKEFFVTSHFPREYLVDDKPNITGGSFGKDLSDGDKVDFTALIFDGDDELHRDRGTQEAFKSIVFAFPELSVGEYQASLFGEVGDLDDGIKLPFKVVQTRFDFEHYKSHTLDKGEVLTSSGIDSVLEDKPVKLIVSDAGEECYYCTLFRYCLFTTSNRLEKQLTKVAASEILSERFDDNTCRVDREALSKFQYFDGGLGQVSWGASNLESTAWGVHVDFEAFDKEQLIEYFNEKLDSSGGGTIQKIYSAWGLTILGQPELNELRVLAETAATFEEKVIVGIALAEVGEFEKAREMYYDILADYAYEYKPYIRIQAEDRGEKEDDRYIEGTSHALLLGSMVEKTYNEGLFNYISDFRGEASDVVIDLSIISFISDQLSKLPDEITKIYYKSASYETEKELKDTRSILIPIKFNELDDFTLKVLEGKGEAYFSYFVGSDGFAKLKADDKLKIKRTYKKAKSGGDDIKVGDIIEVRIDFDVDYEKSPPGAYRITDHLPSGLKYISNSGMYGLSPEGWLSQPRDNVIRGSFYNSEYWQLYGKKYIVYYARASSVGEYVAEPAIIQSLKYLDIFQNTDKRTIKVEASNL